MAHSADSRLIVTGHFGGELQFSDSEMGALVNESAAHTGIGTGIAWDAAGSV